jgi:hypothetical protein
MSPLRHRMIEDMQIRNLNLNTQRVYVEQVVRFAATFVNRRNISDLRRSGLANEKHCHSRRLVVLLYRHPPA